MWVVACDKKSDPSTILFMVEQPSRRRWSTKVEDAQVFHDQELANQQVKRLRYGNPRVLNLQTAKFAASRSSRIDLDIIEERLKNNIRRGFVSTSHGSIDDWYVRDLKQLIAEVRRLRNRNSMLRQQLESTEEKFNSAQGFKTYRVK